MGYPTQQQKVDYLFKKLGFAKSKTGIAEDQSKSGGFSGDTDKSPPNEAISSPLVVPSSSIWADSSSIPASPPGSDSAYVEGYRTANAFRMTVDTTVSNNKAFIARETWGNPSSTIKGDWIDTQFGADYIVQVYKGDPNSGGTQIYSDGTAGNDDTWFFDYSSGVLNFNGIDDVSGITTSNVYIIAYRYTGTKGSQPPGGIGTFHNLYVSGISTFVGNAYTQSDLNLGGASAGVTSAFWDASANSFKFFDNVKLELGDSQDLQLYHNGTGSYFDNNTGPFYIRNNVDNDDGGNIIIEAKSGKASAVFQDDEGVRLYFNNAERFSTTDSGVSIGSSLTVAGVSTFSGDVDVDGNLSVAGISSFTGGTVKVTKSVQVTENLNVTGIATITGDVGFKTDINLPDHAIASFGDGEDLKIYHNQANSFIEDTGTGNLVLKGSRIDIQDTSGNELLIAEGGQYVRLNYGANERFKTTGYGVTITGGSLGIGTIAGPATLHIDPAAVGDDTGTVRIKGDLIVDGEQTIINSTTLEISDFIVGIASTATTDTLADGAGIKIGPDNTLLYDHSNTSLKSSENFNLPSGKTYKINGTDVLSATVLGDGVISSRLTTVDTLNHLKVAGISTLVGGSIITGVTTITQLQVGTTGQTLVGITTILDEDNMASDSATALATQQSIKKYVDDQVTAQDLDFAGDSGTGAVDLDSQSLTLAGTSNEIETSASGQTITLGLPNDVTIGNDLTVTGDIASVTNLSVTGFTTITKDLDVLANAGIGSLAVSGISTFTGNIDANGALDVDGTSDLDQVNIAEGLNVTAGVSTFAKEVGIGSALSVAGVSTFTGNIDANGNLDVDGQTDLDVLNVSDTATFSALLDANKSVQIAENLDVTGISTFDKEVGIGSALTVAGVSTFSSDINLPDNIKVSLGTDDDGSIKHTGSNLQILETTGNIQITNYANDKDVVINTDDGSGGTTNYFTADGSTGEAILYNYGTARIKTSGIGVTITDQLDVTRIKASGITTTATLNVGTSGQTLVGITTILDEDNMASNSATALATQQSIKAYVDTTVTAQDLDIAGDSGTGAVDLDSQSLTIAGTSNEIETSASGQTLTVGLPDDVTIGNNLTVTGKSTLTKEVGISSALSVAGVSTFVGITSFTSLADFDGGIAATTAKVEDLTEDRVVIAGAGGELEDSGNLTFDGSTLLVTGTLNSTVDVQINGTSVADSALNDAVAMAIALG